MKFLRGGELYRHLRKAARFDEGHARFYVIQIAMALGHLHSIKVVHRDLKLRNIFIDADGYIAVSDFGLSKMLDATETTNTYCGTPEYMAPEILDDGGHAYPVDWWALGILTYELLVGFTPFYTGGRDQKKMYRMIKSSKVIFPDEHRHSIKLSDECKSFISQLLDKSPESRLGSSGGMDEVMKHPWLNGIDLAAIYEKKMTPPMKP